MKQGRLVAEEQADHRAWLDRQPMTARCAVCPWTFEGTAGEGRTAAEAHRQKAHPELKPGRLSTARKKQEKERKAELAKAIENVDKRRRQIVQARDAAPRPRRREVTRAPRQEWTRTGSLTALADFIGREGRCPQYVEMNTAHGLPSATWVAREFGSFADYIVAGGHPRPTRGRTPGVTPVRARQEAAGAQAAPEPDASPATVEEELQELLGIPVVLDEKVPSGELRMETRYRVSARTRAAILELCAAITADLS